MEGLKKVMEAACSPFLSKEEVFHLMDTPLDSWLDREIVDILNEYVQASTRAYSYFVTNRQVATIFRSASKLWVTEVLDKTRRIWIRVPTSMGAVFYGSLRGVAGHIGCCKSPGRHCNVGSGGPTGVR